MCCVAEGEGGRGGGAEAVGCEDGGLEGAEGGGVLGFESRVAGDGDVDYAAGDYGGGKEDGGEFDLGGK